MFYRQRYGKTVQKVFEIRGIFLAIFSQFSVKSALSRRKRLNFAENRCISGTVRANSGSPRKNLKTVWGNTRGFESHTLRYHGAEMYVSAPFFFGFDPIFILPFSTIRKQAAALCMSIIKSPYKLKTQTSPASESQNPAFRTGFCSINLNQAGRRDIIGTSTH